MTEEKNPPTPRAGIFLFLGKRKQQRRASHIPTAPAAAVRLVQNLNLKGASSTTVPALPQAHSSIGKDSPSRSLTVNRVYMCSIAHGAKAHRSAPVPGPFCF